MIYLIDFRITMWVGRASKRVRNIKVFYCQNVSFSIKISFWNNLNFHFFGTKRFIVPVTFNGILSNVALDVMERSKRMGDGFF